MCKVSFILPVYNVEQYLERCVGSVEEQCVDAEIILVDDGSTDGSGVLAENLSQGKDNIFVIHQKNGGLSAARNTGLRFATGEYVLFVDSDDWLLPNTVDKLVEAADQERLDVGVADFIYYDEGIGERDNKIKPFHFNEPVVGEEFFLQSLKHRSTLKMVWKSIYRREFLIENNLFFREGYNHEDEEWTPRVYLKAKKMLDIDIVFYCYYIRAESISNQKRSFAKNAYDLISNCYELKSLSGNIENNELRCLFQDRTVGIFLSAVYKGNLVGRQYSELVNKNFFSNLYMEKKTKMKVLLFCFSKHLYCFVNNHTKY